MTIDNPLKLGLSQGQLLGSYPLHSYKKKFKVCFALVQHLTLSMAPKSLNKMFFCILLTIFCSTLVALNFEESLGYDRYKNKMKNKLLINNIPIRDMNSLEGLV